MGEPMMPEKQIFLDKQKILITSTQNITCQQITARNLKLETEGPNMIVVIIAHRDDW
jgi:hypothetical protein